MCRLADLRIRLYVPIRSPIQLVGAHGEMLCGTHARPRVSVNETLEGKGEHAQEDFLYLKRMNTR